LWKERFSTSKTEERERTVGHQLEKFLEENRQRQKPLTHREIAMYLRSTLATRIWASETAIDTIDEQTISRHYSHLCNQHLSPGRHNKLLGFFRRFVEWLFNSGLLENLPRNLKLKSQRLKQTYKAIKTFDNVKQAVLALPQEYQIWAWLGLNCGMTNADLGKLTWEQIDTKRWILTRRRSKTENQPNAPTVRYKLWQETIDGLKALHPLSAGIVFLTKNNTPRWQARIDPITKKTKRKDLFASAWQQIEPKPAIPLGKFRSIGATVLKTDKVFRQFKDVFLANVPSSVSDRFYSAESDEPFFEALDFIRRSLG
jgi:integrase